MTIRKLERKLNGRQVGREIYPDELEEAEDNGLLVCYVDADDWLNFRGVLNDEWSTFKILSLFLYTQKDGTIGVINEEQKDEMEEILQERDIEVNTVKIWVEWNPKGFDYVCMVHTELPHLQFDTYSGDELYCSGIIIEEKEIIKKLKQ